MPATKAEVTNVYIKVNGGNLEPALMSKLKSVLVESALGLPDKFTISFNDESAQYIEKSIGATFDIGKPITISFVTYGSSSTQGEVVFDGEITSIAPEFDTGYGATLVVMGYDKSHRLMRGTKSRTFLNQSDSDVVSSIAGEVGLSPSVDSTSVTRDYISQHNQTNMEFLKELAKRNGYHVYVDGRTLYFKKRETVRGSEVSLAWGEKLTSFNVRLSAARQVDKVTVRGWDPSKQEAIVGEASTSSSHPSIGVDSGYSVGKSAFGSAEHVEVRQAVASANDAKNLAQAILDEVNSEFVEAEGLSDGNPKILAGVKVKIENIGSKFGGTYHVTNATHYLDNSIYKTEFRVEGTSPYLLGGVFENSNGSRSTQEYPLWTGVYPAQVTNNNDPDKLNRVKVQYPWLDDSIESDWARVMTVGAGAEMGTHWLPEVNDEVLVAFEHGNFNHPYILGGVYSQKLKPPPESQEGQAIDKKVMKTRSGHTIVMDDTSGSEKITIETSSGHLLSMDDAAKSIEFTTAGNKFIKIDDQGNKIAIEGATTVDIKSSNALNVEGTTVTIKGTGTVKVEAPKIDLNATGMVTVKGATVQIG